MSTYSGGLPVDEEQVKVSAAQQARKALSAAQAMATYPSSNSGHAVTAVRDAQVATGLAVLALADEVAATRGHLSDVVRGVSWTVSHEAIATREAITDTAAAVRELTEALSSGISQLRTGLATELGELASEIVTELSELCTEVAELNSRHVPWWRRWMRRGEDR